jgi:hypothetical protein
LKWFQTFLGGFFIVPETHYTAADMKKQICESCSQEMEILAKFCHWCGNGPNLREAGMTQRVCTKCKEARSGSFSFCPWCGEDFKGDRKMRKKARGFPFDGLTCPSCKGAVLKSMEYCPWCREDLKDSGAKKECPSCEASIGENWQHCIYCGSFTQQIARLSTDYTVSITREALFFLTLATAERHLEKRRHLLFFTKNGFETFGYVFGNLKDNCFTIEHLYPIASAKSRQDSVEINNDTLTNMNRVIRSFKVSCKSLGVFHNHPDAEHPYPSIGDYDWNLRNEHISIIVAIEDAAKTIRWRWNEKGFFLEGTVSKLHFRIGAYKKNGGMAEALQIDMSQ